MRRILIRKSIEPSITENFTHFDDVLCGPNGLYDLTVKSNQTKQVTSDEHRYQVDSCETMLIELE